MNLKKLIKKSIFPLSLAIFTLPISLSTNAIKPTPEQLESFYSPFDKAYTERLTSHYSNIGYLVGFDALARKLGEKFFAIVHKLHPPEDFATFSEYQSHLIRYSINTTKLLELDREITLLGNIVIKDTAATSPNTSLLSEFYEELPSILSIDDCKEFIAKSRQFVEKWNARIKASSGSIGDSPLDAYNDKFSNARKEAQANFALFFANV